MKFGKILGWSGGITEGVGLMVLFDLEEQEVVMIPCETAPTMRALRNAFPDGNVTGQHIGYETNDLGIMTSFRIEGDDVE